MILEKIAQSTRKRVEEKKKEIPLPKIRALAEQTQGKEPFLFEKALSEGNPAFICEVKKHPHPKVLLPQSFNICRLPESMKQQAQRQFPV